jgi:hypothetical protein
MILFFYCKIILVTWVSEHHAILQQKNTIILVTRVSEHHAILQQKNKIILVTWVTEHLQLQKDRINLTEITPQSIYHLIFHCSIAWCSDTHMTNMICCFILV